MAGLGAGAGINLLVIPAVGQGGEGVNSWDRGGTPGCLQRRHLQTRVAAELEPREEALEGAINSNQQQSTAIRQQSVAIRQQSIAIR